METNNSALELAPKLKNQLERLLKNGLSILITELYRLGITSHSAKVYANITFDYHGRRYQTRLYLAEVKAIGHAYADGRIAVKSVQYFLSDNRPISRERTTCKEFHLDCWFQNISQQYWDYMEPYFPELTIHSVKPKLEFDSPQQLLIKSNNDSYLINPCICGSIHVIKNDEFFEDVPYFKIADHKQATFDQAAALVEEIYQNKLKADGEILIQSLYEDIEVSYKFNGQSSERSNSIRSELMAYFEAGPLFESTFNLNGTTIQIAKNKTFSLRRMLRSPCFLNYARLIRQEKVAGQINEFHTEWIDRVIEAVSMAGFVKCRSNNIRNDDLKAYRLPDEAIMEKVRTFIEETDDDELLSTIYVVSIMRWIPDNDVFEMPTAPRPHQVQRNFSEPQGLYALDVSGREEEFDSLIDSVVDPFELSRYRELLIKNDIIPDNVDMKPCFCVVVKPAL